MIKMQELTPEVYYNNSRDFQFIGRLFDLVLNATKTEADILFSLPLSANSPDHLLNLMATTFGLRLDASKYTSDQLRAVCSIAPKLMRYKGSLKAIEYLCNALLRVEGMEEMYLIEQAADDPYHLIISLPTQAKHKVILDEILPYITPAGVTFSIRQAFFTFVETSTPYALSEEVVVGHGDADVQNRLVKPTDLKSLRAANIFVQQPSFYTESNKEAIGKSGFAVVAGFTPKPSALKTEDKV